MADQKGTVYHLEKADDALQFENAVKNIKGVTFARVDTLQMTFEYAIDEWSSDYDVFTQIMEIIDDYGVSFDFSYAEKQHNSIKQFEITGNEEMQSEFIARGLETETIPEVDDVEDEKEPKKKKRYSQIFERLIEIGASIVFFIISLFVQNTFQYMTYALAFALSGYEILYKAITKIIKKQFINEELIISIAFVVAVFIGYTKQAVAACLIWSVGEFLIEIVKNKIQTGKVAYFAPDKLSVLRDDDTEIEVELAAIGEGDRVVYLAGDVCVIDGTVDKQVKISRMTGEKIVLNEGEVVFAGDKLLENCNVTALYGESSNKNYAYNQKVKAALEQKASFEKKFESKKTVYLSVLLGICALIAFVLPVFETTYKVGLTKWLYRATVTLSVCGFSMLFGSLSLNIYCALSSAKKQNVLLGDYDFAEKVSKSERCVLDAESSILNDGQVQENTRGAIRELKDCNIKKISVLTSLADEDAEEICKEYKIHEYYANRTKEQKLEILNELSLSGAICVCNETFENEKGVSVCMDAKNDEYVGNACILDGEIKSLPYVIKIAKRTEKIKKTNCIVTVVAKIVVCLLATLGVIGMPIAAAIDVAVGSLACLNALSNNGEII